MNSPFVHYAWMRFGRFGSFCSTGDAHTQLSWNRREIDCPRCLAWLDSLADA